MVGATAWEAPVHQAPIPVGGEEVAVWPGGETLGFVPPGGLTCRELELHQQICVENVVEVR